jgi:hypothetical protein
MAVCLFQILANIGGPWPNSANIHQAAQNPLNAYPSAKQNLVLNRPTMPSGLDGKNPLFTGILAYAAAAFRKTLHLSGA